MALNIKNTAAEELVRQLADATGETVTRAVVVAARERLDRLASADQAAADERAARLRKIAEDAGGRWVEPYRSTNHGSLLYDDQGMPR